MGLRTADTELTNEDPATAQVGPEIRDLRKAKRMTIKELSLATSLSIGHLSEIERGIASPSIKTLHDIARALGLWIGERCFTLGEGDSFSFPSTMPHRYRNPGKVEAVVVWVITPPTY